VSFAEQKATAGGSPAEHAFLYHDHWPYGAVLTLPPATFGSAVSESATSDLSAAVPGYAATLSVPALLVDGTYTETGNRDIDFGRKNLTVTSQTIRPSRVGRAGSPSSVRSPAL